MITQPSLCSTFIRLGRDVWTTQEDAQAHGLTFGEESLTDSLLLELKRAHGSAITIVPFTKAQEAKNGADWAWWFQGTNWFGMRVQAKKLDPKSLRYKSLRQNVGKTSTLQADVLIAAARRDNLVPMYCFYNYWDVTKQPLAGVAFNCGSFSPTAQMFGCMLGDAIDVYNAAIKNKKDDLKTIAAIAFPWTCLVCCTATGIHPDLASLASSIVMMRQAAPQKRGGDRGGQRRRIRPRLVETPPDYVLAALRGEEPERGVPEDLAGLVVFHSEREPRRGEGLLRVRRRR